MKPSALALLLIAIVVATFGAVRDFAFLNFDDNVILSDNPFVRGGLSWINVQWALTHQVIGQWQPLTTISHQLDCQLFGLDAGAHHVVNLLFHLGSALALFIFVRRLTGTLGEAFFVAAIFALHPMRIESVAWVAERKDVLSVFFGMLALTSYLGGRRTLTMIFFAASLAAKPMLVTLPLIFLLVDQLRGRVSLADKIPYAALSLLFSVAALVAQSGGGALRSNAEAPVAERLATAFVGYLAHLGKFFWPTALGIFYPSTTYFPGVGAGALLGLVAITAFCHQRRWLRFGWL